MLTAGSFPRSGVSSRILPYKSNPVATGLVEGYPKLSEKWFENLDTTAWVG